jgi:gamma-glutamyltranspeptidase/glutathione hydrolase
MAGIRIQFSEADQLFHCGPGSVGVPGMLDGLVAVHAAHGRLSLADVLAPAARLAREGVALEPVQASVLTLLAEIFALTDECAATYLPGGVPPAAGTVLRNPALADVLDAMGRGDVRGIADLPGIDEALAAVAATGSALTLADLHAYAPARRAPLVVDHHGAQVLTNPAPAFGGPILAAAVQALAALGPAGADPAGRTRVVAALRDATAREKRLRATTGAAVRGTTHVSVVDADGRVAALTQSNGSCSGVLVPGTGVHLNNVMGEEDLHPDGLHRATPGARIGSMMAPSVVALPDGSVVGLGSGGSERIRSALLQVVVALVDRGQPLADAVTAPRLHWDGDAVQAEPPLDDATRDALAALGPVAVWPDRSLYFGGAHIAAWHPDGRVEAVGDPRRGGCAAVVPVP